MFACRRFLVAAVLLLAGLPCRSRAADPAVVINEIHYHPVGTDSEWIELHSLSGVDIDLSGWRFSAGVDYTFPEGTKIAGHGWLVVAANPGAASLAGLGALGPWAGALDNGGETLTLVNRDGREMDTVAYSNGGDWPTGPDGSGATLARRNSESADPNPASWAASADVGGTPGRANFALPGQAPALTTASDLGSPWKFFVGAPPAGWQQPGFDDSSWTTAPSLFYSGAPTLAGGTADLLGYWPLDAVNSGTTPNLAPGGAAAVVTGAPDVVADPQRGNVLRFSGNGQQVNAGSALVPPMTLSNDFTWAFWASPDEGASDNVILGNRYSPTPGTDWDPREFIKFTGRQFEFHHDGAGENIDYDDLAANGGWTHHAVVKSGRVLTYYRDGVASGSRTITGGLNHPQPLYFGGDQGAESWQGRLDDPAVWTRALTGAQVAALAGGSATPLNVSAAGTLRTALAASGQYAFRRAFTFGGTPSRTTLNLRLLVEGGVTVWLNGQQVYTQSSRPAAAGATQSRGRRAGRRAHRLTNAPPGADAVDVSADIPLPASALVRGNNVLAVQVTPASGNAEMVFGAVLTASEAGAVPADETAGLMFNEISAGGAGFQLELANFGGSTLDLTGCVIASSSGARATLSGTLAAGGFLTLTAAQLGFTPVKNDTLFLYRPGGVELLDARQVTNKLRGRSPLFGNRWLYPSAATFGAANAFAFNTSVVINEVMYDQRPLGQSPYAADPEQWVELYNRGTATVTLTGWSFTDGISYKFASGTTIPAGGYLVVSNNASALQAKWPAVASRIVGNFTGSIKHGGERLQLSDASGNPVNEVTFSKDAPWPVAAHGGGSSLELRDPRADNRRPEAWAASNESARGSWQTYTFDATGTPGAPNDPAQWNEFIFGLLGAGTVLVDDVSVTENPGGSNRQLIQNGGFDTGADGWRFLGTHSHASVVDDPSGTGKVLRVDATDASEHMHNHVETTLKSGGAEVALDDARTYRVSFRARWVSGSNQLNTRLYFDRAAHTTLLPVAGGGGTPGAANTARVANLGPTFTGLTHSPAVPAAGQPATVSVTVADPDGVGAVALFYAVEGGAFSGVAMASQGAGQYAATVPGQAAGTRVQFYLRATDGLGASGFAPPDGADSRAMIPWDDGQARLAQNGVMPNNVRIVLTPADTATLHAPTNVMSNDPLRCTVVWNERDVYYDCSTHLHGSEHGRDQPTRVSFNVHFPGGQPLLGEQDAVVIDRSGAGNQTSQKEILIKRAITHAGGLPGSEDDLCRVIAPRPEHTGPAILGRQRIVTDDYLDSAYPDGGDGDLFKYELIYAPLTTDNGTSEGFKLPEPDDVRGVGVGSLGPDKESYRWHWLISNNTAADDYGGLLTFLAAFGRSGTPDAQYFTDTNALMDVSEWLRGFAVETLFGVGDNYATGGQHNLYLYRPPGGRWTFFPYDMDFTFEQGATSPLFQNGDLAKLVSTSQPQGSVNLRTYWAQVYDLCQTSFSSAFLAPWAAHYSAFTNEDLTQFMGYVDTRRAYALDQLYAAVPPTSFGITTPGGSAPVPTVTIQGRAWLDVAQMRLAGSGVPLAVTWTGPTAWQTPVTIAPGPNTITIKAYDSKGVVVGTDSVTITGLGATAPADATNLVISEIMYHPGAPTTAERDAGFNDAEAFEFIELQNINAMHPVSLAGARFTAGVTFTLPDVTLAPGARAVLVGNRAAFAQRYGGAGFTVLGEYQPGSRLSNSGDRITLLDAQGATIHDFVYDDHAPWPASADGGGYSLVLINPGANPDPADPANWRASVAPGGNPGSGDASAFSGDPLATDDGGVSNLLRYALAGAAPLRLPVVTVEGGFLTLTFQRNLAADDAPVTVQRATDLAGWSDGGADVVLAGETHNADGTATYVWRSAHPQGETAREFLRLRVSLRASDLGQ